MGWTNMPATDGTDWADLAFRTQFMEAIRERYFAIGVDGVDEWDDVPMPAVGDAAAHHDGNWHDIGGMQLSVSFMAPFYCPPGDYTGQSYGVGEMPHYTVASLWAAAGINAGGWIRKYPREITSLSDPGVSGQRARLKHAGLPPYVPTGAVYYEYTTSWEAAEDQTSPPDTITDYGAAAIGDYVGPWLFNELRACLDLMMSVPRALTVPNPGTSKDTMWSGLDYFPTYAAAKAGFEAWWAAHGAPSVEGNLVTAWTVCQRVLWSSPPDVWYDRIHGNRQTAVFVLANRAADDLGHLSCDVAYYFVGTAAEEAIVNTFSDQGDNVADGLATLIETQAGVDGGCEKYEAASFPAGLSDDLPDNPYADEPEPGGDAECTGYTTLTAFAVMDFAVENGFVYVAEA
jgi:hypothetical protein